MLYVYIHIYKITYKVAQNGDVEGNAEQTKFPTQERTSAVILLAGCESVSCTHHLLLVSRAVPVTTTRVPCQPCVSVHVSTCLTIYSLSVVTQSSRV